MTAFTFLLTKAANYHPKLIQLESFLYLVTSCSQNYVWLMIWLHKRNTGGQLLSLFHSKTKNNLLPENL